MFKLIVNYYDEKCLQLKTLLIKRLVLKLYVTVLWCLIYFSIAILNCTVTYNLSTNRLIKEHIF